MISGQTRKKVDDKYLGILESDKFKEREMKDIFRTEYLGWLKLVMKSQLNGKKQDQSRKHLGCVAHEVPEQ